MAVDPSAEVEYFSCGKHLSAGPQIRTMIDINVPLIYENNFSTA